MIRLLDFRHLRVTGAVERSRGHNQNSGINQKGKVQGEERVQEVVAHGRLHAFRRAVNGARLHQGGMQIKIVRHDGGAQDADGDVEHFRVGEDLRRGDKPLGNRHHVGAHQEKFNQVAPADDPDQRDHHGFQIAEAFVLEIENGQHVERRQADSHAAGECEKAG